MKHWKETAEILGRAADLASCGRSAAVATVVQIRGSAYRRPGAKFLVEDDGRTLGGVSGGCLEADVREIALAVLRTGIPRLVHYDTGTDDRTVWGLGLGCNGSVDVFVQPAAIEALAPLRALLDGDDPIAVCTVIEGEPVGRALVATWRGVAAGETGRPALDDELAAVVSRRLRAGESALETAGARRVFTDVLIPPLRLLVCGAGDDARPLVRYAADAGFVVTVADHRPAYLTAERFGAARQLLLLRPDDAQRELPAGPCYAVIMTHSLALDREWVRRLLSSGVAYVGLLGPRARAEEILEQLGLAAEPRVFGPVGLDLGADGPEQIAISIVGEMLAVRAGREARHLRERGVAIHAR